MTAEEMFCMLHEKYGDAFQWEMVPFTESRGILMDEFRKELPSNDPIHSDPSVRAVAKSTTGNDVLYLIGNKAGDDTYRICHLTYTDRPLQCIIFDDLQAVTAHFEKQIAYAQISG